MERFCHADDCAELLPGDARTDAEYCSNGCRQREYRRRKAILAPFDGDAQKALMWAFRGLNSIIGVTGNADASRNAKGGHHG